MPVGVQALIGESTSGPKIRFWSATEDPLIDLERLPRLGIPCVKLHRMLPRSFAHPDGGDFVGDKALKRISEVLGELLLGSERHLRAALVVYQGTRGAIVDDDARESARH